MAYLKGCELLPDESLDVCEENLKEFFETMYERQIIWKRRFIDQSPRPWTKDPILRDNKFTNVYRELDRNSQWQIKNILLDKELQKNLKNLVWKMMVYRTFNNPETFEFDAKGKTFQQDLFLDKVETRIKSVKKAEKLISASQWKNGIPDYDEYDKDEFEKFIAGIRATGMNPFTNAYLINSQSAPGQSRDWCYTNIVIPTLHAEIPNFIELAMSCKNAAVFVKAIDDLPSVGAFIAHEYYQDFTYYARYCTERLAQNFFKFDQNVFTNVGPGCRVGIRLIFPSASGSKQTLQKIYDLRDMADEWLEKIGEERGEAFPYLGWNKFNNEYFVYEFDNLGCSTVQEANEYTSFHYYKGITLHQIEMWLCEYQKYWKMKYGVGKQRSKFTVKTKRL
jgi:hypothetical protein